MQDNQLNSGPDHDAAASGGVSEERGIRRRTVVKGAAWSLPVIAAAMATPLASASTLCSVGLSTTTATFARLSSTSAVFTWTNIFGDGKDLTLTLTAVHNGAFNMAINPANNLVLDNAMHGGEAVPSVRLSLDTADLRDIGGGERVTFSFALDDAPLTVDDLTYKVKDIDGFLAQDGRGGAERISVSAGTGTYDAAWVHGQGTGVDPWRLTTTVPNVEVADSSASGNVNIAATAISAFDLTFVANNSGRSVGDRPNQNIWVGPFAFTAVNPTCI